MNQSESTMKFRGTSVLLFALMLSVVPALGDRATYHPLPEGGGRGEGWWMLKIPVQHAAQPMFGVSPIEHQLENPSALEGHVASQDAPPKSAAPEPLRPASFLLDNSRKPHISISWPCADGSITSLQADRDYESPKQASPIGKNLTAYVALGGNRGDLGLGTPGTVDVRVGFYAIDKKKPMFADIAKNAMVTVEFTGITFNQPARARPLTTIQHLKFEGNDKVLGCAGDPGLLATYNTMDPNETLRGNLTKRNGRPGILAESKNTIEFRSTDTGVVSMKAVLPYALFKHADDPWLTSNPGDFVEPVHFHVEFECEPVTGVKAAPSPNPPPKPID